MTIQTINPTTGESYEYEAHSDAQVATHLSQAQRAFEKWRMVTLADRSEVLLAAADLLRQERHEHATCITEEMGKPICQAEAEIDKCARVCEYYADNAASFLAEQSADVDQARTYVRFDPLGPVLAIMPWNFPFWQVFRCAVPALMAGNVVLLKHAANVPRCAGAIEEIFHRAGFPHKALIALRVRSSQVAALIGHPAVRAVTLTGSEAAGKAVAEEAGKHLKKCVLELGGSDPFMVLADADIANAAEKGSGARTNNAGQSCIAAKRFIVHESVAEAFAGALVARMQQLQMGDPRDRTTQIGPLARHDLREDLHNQVVRTIDAGATLLCGGELPTGKGFFYPPTVLADVEPGMAAFDEETFGPVAAVIRARDVAHALELANRSRFGLGASIWTADSAQGERLAGDLECGCVFVNDIVKSDPHVPFGGVKNSGFGRELASFGIREFTNIKTVWIKSFDVVEEASQESFPASDAPSWTPVTKS